MDDGFEGFMPPHRTAHVMAALSATGPKSVALSQRTSCSTLDEPWIPEAKKTELMNFFQTADAFGFLIYGHTDSRASDACNMNLSQRRADMVPSVARGAGARVVDVKGFGER